MNKSAKRTDGKKADGGGQLWLRLSAMVREALYDTVMVTGLARRRILDAYSTQDVDGDVDGGGRRRDGIDRGRGERVDFRGGPVPGRTAAHRPTASGRVVRPHTDH